MFFLKKRAEQTLKQKAKEAEMFLSAAASFEQQLISIGEKIEEFQRQLSSNKDTLRERLRQEEEEKEKYIALLADSEKELAQCHIALDAYDKMMASIIDKLESDEGVLKKRISVLKEAHETISGSY